jgi:L-amino acid N-acyltransferase YncA
VQIRDWIGDIVKAGLPCFVAVTKRNQRKKPGAAPVSETIAGWIHLEPYSAGPMHRFSSELALYVHPGYIRQGIGKCLLDKLMDYADTSYKKKGGYEYVNNFEYLKTGNMQILKTITVRMHYEGDDAEWATTYFGDYGFKRAGRYYEIGHKIGKVVNVVMFQYHTSEKIDPRSVPNPA